MKLHGFPILRWSLFSLLAIVSMSIISPVWHEVVASPTGFDCSELTQWAAARAATGQWVIKVKDAIIEDSQISATNKMAEFRLLTSQLENAIFNALLTEETNNIPGMLNSYGDELKRIFLTGPDTFPDLFHDYSDQITRIFGDNGLPTPNNPRSACGG
jgi:hypothetical protein